jgi:hypothetical protein
MLFGTMTAPSARVGTSWPWSPMRASLTLLSIALVLTAGCPGTHTTEDAGTDAPVADTAPVLDAPGDAPSSDVPTSDVPTSDAPTSDGGLDCGMAQDARGEGPCAAFLGYAWIGNGCAGISGCSCVGTDCDALFDTDEACAAAYPTCPRNCGGLTPFGSPGCLGTEFCDYPTSSFCGGDDSQGLCTLRPLDCPEPGGVPVCGCDGTDYLTECSANLAGTDAARFGSCAPPTP